MIQTRTDSRRGCGFRKTGGMYLVASSDGRDCGRFPIPFHVCPTCSQGIKPARGWTWIDPLPLYEQHPCKTYGESCFGCPMYQPQPSRVGLIWIGGSFYPTVDDFRAEVAQQGISRRISRVPRDFVLGETWVWLAHRKCIKTDDVDENGDAVYLPGVFMAFKPNAIEYVVKDDDDDETLQRLVDRGITPIRIERAQTELFSKANGGNHVEHPSRNQTK